MLSKKFKYYLLLFSIFFFHLISIILCALQDIARELKNRPTNHFASIKNISYGFGFMAWLSAWASLLTLFGVVYRLIKKNNNTYGTQFFDLTVTVANIIMGVIFTAGGLLSIITCGKKRLLTNVPREGLTSLKGIPVNFGLFQLSAYHTGIIYNLAGHIIAPSLVIYFFGKFSATNLLEKNLKTTLLASLFNPTIWLFYVFWRPLIDRRSYRFKTESYHYPHDYPFPFFNRCVGKPTGKGDTYQSTWWKQIFGIFLVFGAAYLTFSLLSYYLIKGKSSQPETNLIKFKIFN